MPFVYFIHEEGCFNCFKIGKTENNPEERLSQLQTGNPRKLIIYRFILTDNHSLMESFLHNKYKEFRIQNEWFNITQSVIDEECDSILSNNGNLYISGKYEKCNYVRDKKTISYRWDKIGIGRKC